MCIMVLMTGLLVFAGDGNYFNNEELPVEKDIASIASQVETPNDNTMTASPVGMQDNNNDFACKLFRTIIEQKGVDSSIVVSPISVSYLLGMLNEGADGETRQQITDVLGLGGSVQEINKYFKKMMGDAQSVDPSVTLKNANCIYFKLGMTINPKFKADMQNYYDANVEAINFNSSSILNNINNWCKTHTDGIIPELVTKEELNPLAVMYLLNAVYFKASWTDQIDPRSTRDLDFIIYYA